MNAGDITAPKPASSLGFGKESTWSPYGLPAESNASIHTLPNPNELISRQFAVLWEIISPVGHILYGLLHFDSRLLDDANTFKLWLLRYLSP